MEPSDARSIAESLIQSFSKDIEYMSVCERIFDLPLSEEEEYYLIEEVWDLIENAKIAVTFEGESE